MSKNKKVESDFECEEITDICGFTDDPMPVPQGKCISSFSFEDDITDGDDNKSADYAAPTNNTSNTNTPLNSITGNDISSLSDERITLTANGSTPLIDGEKAAIKRSYTLRASTIRKINELKNLHPNINICISTIVDIAIDYYHDYVTSEINNK